MILNKVHLAKTQVDFDLLDPGNVLYHPNYLVLCDRARAQALSDAGCSFIEMWNEHLALALVETETKYRAPAQMGQNLAISTRLIEHRRSSIQVEQKLFLIKGECTFGYVNQWDDSLAEKILFEAKIKMVSVCLQPMKAVKLPEKLEKALGLN